MKYKKLIDDYLEDSGGMISSSYCKESGIPTIYLNRMEKENKLSKAVKGLYITKDADYDELYFFQYRFKKAIYSYETALYLLGVSDNLPSFYNITVYNNYKFNEISEKVNVNYVKKSIYELGIIKIKTKFGNYVNIYSYERIICDVIKHKKKMDSEFYINTLKSYSTYKEKNITCLFDIARAMNIETKVREIMELIL